MSCNWNQRVNILAKTKKIKVKMKNYTLPLAKILKSTQESPIIWRKMHISYSSQFIQTLKALEVSSK